MLALLLLVFFVIVLVLVAQRPRCNAPCARRPMPRLASPALVYVPMSYPRDTGNSDRANSVLSAKSCARPASLRP